MILLFKIEVEVSHCNSSRSS